MPSSINQQQIESVLALPAPERYGHFIRRVADFEELWGLRTEAGWVTLAADDGTKSIPFWPHPAYAELLATAEWSDAAAERLGLSGFLEWLPSIEENGYLIAVFPTPGGRGVVVKPRELRSHLTAECQQYE